jgi:hypothetical protein
VHPLNAEAGAIFFPISKKNPVCLTRRKFCPGLDHSSPTSSAARRSGIVIVDIVPASLCIYGYGISRARRHFSERLQSEWHSVNQRMDGIESYLLWPQARRLVSGLSGCYTNRLGAPYLLIGLL